TQAGLQVVDGLGLQLHQLVIVLADQRAYAEVPDLFARAGPWFRITPGRQQECDRVVPFDSLAPDHPNLEDVVHVAQRFVALTTSLLKLTFLARELFRWVPGEPLDHLVGLLFALPI